MAEKNFRKIFYILALALLIGMIVISRDAGISGDEEVHYKQSEMVYSFFSSLGKDQSSLYTPETHLQYYGQAFDNVVTILIHWFGIEDIYSFRHLMCSISGWLTIVVTALFAAYLAGYSAAILVLLLFAVSPVFMGHSQNNLKDIPFALAYISSIYFSMKLAFQEEKPKKSTILFLILSIALAIGIRVGGILVLFYYGLFLIIRTISDWISWRGLDWPSVKKSVILFIAVSISGYLLALALWPYALQNPLINPWKSYLMMTHFPTTVRQIFEGNFDWSDFHPWYYLPKYMAITIPIVVLTGLALFLANFRKKHDTVVKWQLGLLAFTILFPVSFVILKNSNLYGSWRHFLFVYPAIVLFSALGIQAFLTRFRIRILNISAAAILLIFAFHPVKFMVANHPLYYLYYNQLVGGLKGAYGNYETDYYYESMREGAEWLQQYLKNKSETKEIIVGGNFPSQWYFRNDTNLKFIYFPWQKRSEYDWDYAIVANSYIPPYQLKNHIWPPPNMIHTIFSDGVPICAVIERLSKDDLYAIREKNQDNYDKAALFFQKAIKFDPQNELIYYKFAEMSFKTGENERASLLLIDCLKINPGLEQALVLLGDMALAQNELKKAALLYQDAIKANRKYYATYTKLANVYMDSDIGKARNVLKECLKLNSKYKPAWVALAETYRKTDPETANKYDLIIRNLK